MRESRPAATAPAPAAAPCHTSPQPSVLGGPHSLFTSQNSRTAQPPALQKRRASQGNPAKLQPPRQLTSTHEAAAFDRAACGHNMKSSIFQGRVGSGLTLARDLTPGNLRANQGMPSSQCIKASCERHNGYTYCRSCCLRCSLCAYCLLCYSLCRRRDRDREFYLALPHPQFITATDTIRAMQGQIQPAVPELTSLTSVMGVWMQHSFIHRPLWFLHTNFYAFIANCSACIINMRVLLYICFCTRHIILHKSYPWINRSQRVAQCSL